MIHKIKHPDLFILTREYVSNSTRPTANYSLSQEFDTYLPFIGPDSV